MIWRILSRRERLLSLLICLFVLATSTARGASLTISIEADWVPDGVPIVVRLFQNEQAFPGGAPSPGLERIVIAQSGVAIIAFDDLTPGRYAAVAFADLDGDGRLARYWFGAPAEPVGVSRRSGESSWGPPTFKAASVPVGEAPAACSISLRGL